jgi:phosphate transport system protein
MQTHFEKELSSLKQMLLTMASHAEQSVKNAVDALINRDNSLAEKVKQDDEIIDRFEVEVDDAAITLLAKAPLASQLRLITVTMRLSQNVERVGDEATKIAKRALDLSLDPPLKTDIDLRLMADLSLNLLNASLDAFVRADAATARTLIPLDKEIDELNRRVYLSLLAIMMESPANIQRAQHLITVAKSLERIADHAKNIAEEVVYLCEAEDIRHTQSKHNAPTAGK